MHPSVWRIWLAAGVLACVAVPGRADVVAPSPVKAAPAGPRTKAELRAYAESGAYDREVAVVAARAQAWVEARARLEPRDGRAARLAVVFDLDETLLRNLPTLLAHDFEYVPADWEAWVQAARAPAFGSVLAVYQAARRLGVQVIFLSARRERERAASVRNLRAVGCDDYAALICRPDDSPQASGEFKREQRQRLAREGWVVIANLGDQPSDLEGGGAERGFLIPNPFYSTP